MIASVWSGVILPHGAIGNPTPKPWPLRLCCCRHSRLGWETMHSTTIAWPFDALHICINKYGDVVKA